MICINSLKAAAHNNFNGFYFDWSQNACVKIVWQLGEPIFFFLYLLENYKLNIWIQFSPFWLSKLLEKHFFLSVLSFIVCRWLTSIVITTPGGGGTSLNKPYRFVPHQNLCFLCRYGLKTGKDFAHFGLESGMAFEGTTGVYERICCFKSKWKRNREKYANSKWIIRIFFCWRSDLTNDDIISAQVRLKKGMNFWAQGENGCGNDIFWSEIGSGFGESGGTPPPRIPRNTPPG